MPIHRPQPHLGKVREGGSKGKTPRDKQTGTRTQEIKTSARLLRTNPERPLPYLCFFSQPGGWETGPIILGFFHNEKIILLP